jgi:RNA-directed DNA polymerase
MECIENLNHDEAKIHFLKGSSYLNQDFPKYIGFEPILNDVAAIIAAKSYSEFKSKNPEDFTNVNYDFIANKDGRFAWRPIELIHPVIYVSLVNSICALENWQNILNRLSEFKNSVVTCCSLPVVSLDSQSDQATQIENWWHTVELESLKLSLDYTHILHTDVTDCYGSIYTHSISWALHGKDVAKAKKKDKNLLGNKIDEHIRAGRHGQTNGIAQGSVLMDFIAELVLGYVDELITEKLHKADDFRVLRYRDDYRIFSNSDVRAEQVLKAISDSLREVGMRLGSSKTFLSTNVVEGAIKPDKLAGIDLQDLGDSNAKTIQKQLLRLHSFGRRYPNSGALKRLTSELHSKVDKQKEAPDDLEVQVAIATDIAVVSPSAFPAIAGLLSHMISLAPEENKQALWQKIVDKMKQVPNNGYLEIWLQRVTKIEAVGLPFSSEELICKIVNGETPNLWENAWISCAALKKALDVSKIIIEDIKTVGEVIKPEEIKLFTQNAWAY